MRSEIDPQRRRVLRGIAIAGGGLAALGAGVWAWLPTNEDQTETHQSDFGQLLVLDNRRANIVDAFASASLPSSPGFPSTRDAQVVNRLDEELYFVSKSIRSDFRTIVDVVDVLPIAHGYFSTFARLSLPRRQEFLHGTSSTNSDTVRVVVSSLRMAVMMMYYGHPAAWAPIGYDGPYEQTLEPIISEQRSHYARKTGRA